MLTFVTCLALSAQASPRAEPDIAALEAHIEQLLQDENAAAVSVAVIEAFEIRWAAAFGVLERGQDREVDEHTLFQAASISKPVTAAAVMRLVDRGGLALDDVANSRLTSWQLPGERADEVTLRLLLSHRAGLTVHGFPGYSPTVELPSVVDVLDGRAPANTAPVRISTPPGSEWRYSGGGYTVVQQLLVDVAGEPFPELLKREVLDPVGMKDSTFELPLPEARQANAARAHDRDGQPLDDPWHVYPEMAAAGLWTTPTDLARFLLEVRASLVGESEFLSRASARAMATPIAGSRTGVGLIASGEGDDWTIGHSGGNWNFICNSQLRVNRGHGVVVMTNGPYPRVLRGVARAAVRTFVQGLSPTFDPDERTAIDVDDEILEAYVGEYRLDERRSLTVTLDDGNLFVQPNGQPKHAAFAESETKFFLAVIDAQFTFTKNEEGAVTGLTWHQNGRDLRAGKVR